MIPIITLVLLSTTSLSAAAVHGPNQLPTVQTPHRISGTAQFPMPDVLARKMEYSDQQEVDYVGRICVAADGVPTSVHAIERTGVGQADRQVEKTMLRWRYAPYRVRGQAVPFCTNVRYRFKMPMRESRTGWW